MRVKLCEKYQTEREAVCNRLIEIVDLDDDNSFKSFKSIKLNTKFIKLIRIHNGFWSN